MAWQLLSRAAMEGVKRVLRAAIQRAVQLAARVAASQGARALAVEGAQEGAEAGVQAAAQAYIQNVDELFGDGQLGIGYIYLLGPTLVSAGGFTDLMPHQTIAMMRMTIDECKVRVRQVWRQRVDSWWVTRWVQRVGRYTLVSGDTWATSYTGPSAIWGRHIAAVEAKQQQMAERLRAENRSAPPPVPQPAPPQPVEPR
ncbi:MAG: hypothetical protein HY744_20015 [Deltaproteobacteria bacterium]|nr:hypothetical protein [Deltaproteobacteria bacterium]